MLKTPVLPFWVLVGFFAFLAFFIKRGRRVDNIRKISGLEALSEAVGRATEMGRPVFYTPGVGEVMVGASSVSTMAAVEILSYVASLTAKYEVDLIVGVSKGDTYAISDATVKQAYAAASKPDAYNPDMVRYYASGYLAACVGEFQRQQPSTILLFGHYTGEIVFLAEAAAQTGAITIGGMERFNQLPMMVASCDHTLVGEEMYVAGAYLSGNTVKLNCVRVQDLWKLAALVLFVAGSVLATFGNTYLVKLFK